MLKALQAEQARTAKQQDAFEQFLKLLADGGLIETDQLTKQKREMFRSLWATTVPPPKPKPLNSRQAAEYLSVTTESLCRWRMSGRGPKFAREGSAIRYDVAVLDAWLRGDPSARVDG
jgi:Helix-turn-helix domain